MNKAEKIFITIGIIVVLLIGVFALGVQPYMEAKTYQKLTGKNVTWWDALWVELRVIE